MDKVSPRGSQRVPVPLKRLELRREIPDLKTLRRSVAGDCRLMVDKSRMELLVIQS